MDYHTMRTRFADALGVDRQLVRAHDMTGLYGIKTGPDREVCCIAESPEAAAEAVAEKMRGVENNT